MWSPPRPRTAVSCQYDDSPDINYSTLNHYSGYDLATSERLGGISLLTARASHTSFGMRLILPRQARQHSR